MNVADTSARDLIGQPATVQYDDGYQTGTIVRVDVRETKRIIHIRRPDGGPTFRARPEKHDIELRTSYGRSGVEEVPYR